MWEAEIKRIMVPGKPRQKVRNHLIRKKLSMLVHACHSSNGEKYKIGGLRSRQAWTKSKTLS
jgi:hypothetical protein